MRLCLRLRQASFLAVVLGVAGATSGCEAPEWLTRAAARIPGASALFAREECEFGNPVGCPPERVCAYTSPRRAECVARFVGPTPFVRFPFEPTHPVVCLEGTGKRGGTHTTPESLFAVDLATRPADALPGTVSAAIDGTALVYRSCADRSVRDEAPAKAGPSVAPSNPICESGLGNHVRILNPDGHMLLYANLGAVWVEDGQVVRAGDPLGREGRSGKASERRLRFSVHFAPIDSWLETLSYYRAHPEATPPSIPFETQFCDPERSTECVRRRARMDELPCGPKSTTLLRADWRD